MLKKDDRCSSEEEDNILDVVCPADLLYDFQEHSTEPDDEFEDELGSEFEDELGEAAISEEASEMLAQLHTLGPLGFISLQRTLAQCTSSDILHTFGLSMPEGMEHAPEHARWEYVKQILIRYVYIRPRNVKVCSTVCDVVHLLRTCRNIMIVSGAGISVACGIPDFRSEGGLYEQIRERFGLPEPECMFDIAYFRRDPQPFFAFAKPFGPSFSHRFIRSLEEHGQLLRNYTQNIDTLERVAGIGNVVYCHGSFATSTCMSCEQKFTLEQLKQLMLASEIPRCTDCPDSVVKPDIVFFGQSLPPIFDASISRDVEKADLLLVIGSSMKVHPVSSIPDMLPPHVPQILINRERVDHCFDVELLGDSDTILQTLQELMEEGPERPGVYEQIGPFTFTFHGAKLPIF